MCGPSCALLCSCISSTLLLTLWAESFSEPFNGVALIAIPTELGVIHSFVLLCESCRVAGEAQPRSQAGIAQLNTLTVLDVEADAEMLSLADSQPVTLSEQGLTQPCALLGD